MSITFPNFDFLRRSQRCLREVGSKPAVGSSKTTISHSPSRAMAIEVLRFWPPERLLTSLFMKAPMFSSFLTLVMAAWISLLGIPLKMENNYRCSYAVRLGKMMFYCGQMPIFSLFFSRKR
mmetsp:Transcript_72242/g.156109  ORF Transcript_72242/g.156109 Transcript_72242/m.156109 type:complete len:121 (-) Transcript_72242:1971-2333(-)